jgi:hypothetical protein
MPTTRRVTWTTNPSADQVAAARELGRLVVDWPNFYRDPAVGGNALGVIQIAVTVSDHDRWQLSQRIRKLRAILENAAGIPLPAVAVEVPPPHRHPGRGARWQRRPMTRN